MISDQELVFAAPRPAIAYAVTEGGRLLYADPPARAAREAAAIPWREGIPVKERECHFSLGGREMMLSLLLLGESERSTDAGERALLAAEEAFLSLIHELIRAREEPPHSVLLPHTLAVLRERLADEDAPMPEFQPFFGENPLPVCVRGRALFLSLGIAVGTLSPFGRLRLSLTLDGDVYSLRLASDGHRMSEFPACLLARVAEQSGYGFALTEDGICFEMRSAMTAVALHDVDEALTRAFSLGVRALGAQLF